VLAQVVGKDCNIELIIDDIRAELAGRPYELVAVAGGWQHRTKNLATPFAPPLAPLRPKGQRS
jgi:chromosome segregation and condensation protein ScpB